MRNLTTRLLFGSGDRELEDRDVKGEVVEDANSSEELG